MTLCVYCRKSCSTKNPEKHIAVSTNILSSTTVLTLIITRNVSTAAIHQMISEGSCDTEDVMMLKIQL